MRIALPLALLTALAAPTTAAEFTLTPDDTKVSFFLEATGHDVEGSFSLRDCKVDFDPLTGKASGSISFDALSATTFHKKRDKTMHKKVLESSSYSMIRFVPERLEGKVVTAGKSQVTLHGQVSLLGVTHPLSLPASIEVDGTELQLKTTFTIPYVEWGLKDPSFMFFRAGKVVDVTVVGLGTLTLDEAQTQGSR